jgi:hypothetical protein
MRFTPKGWRSHFQTSSPALPGDNCAFAPTCVSVPPCSGLGTRRHPQTQTQEQGQLCRPVLTIPACDVPAKWVGRERRNGLTARTKKLHRSGESDDRIPFPLPGLREDEGDRRVRSCRRRRTLVIQNGPLLLTPFRPDDREAVASERIVRAARIAARGPLRRPVAIAEQRPRRSSHPVRPDFGHSGHVSILGESDGGCGSSTT